MKVRKTVELEVPELGERIKQAREKAKAERGLSLAKICEQVGMTYTNWYKIENGETKFLPLSTLRDIELVLGVDFDVKFEGGDRG